ncbi:MAG: AAA family ATPase [Desulfovibrionaceae bacterium]|nr:AAA family ATPase [Desulfovibrionaceae bacterium]
MPNFKVADLNRLPYGNPTFSDIREENMIYVDKTALIADIASQRVPLFFSRPRRFGKSLLINTLSSLFTHGLEYFHGLDIEKIWTDKTYLVVHLDFSSMAEKKPQVFSKDLGETIIKKFRMEGIVSQRGEFGIRSPDRILDDICENLKNKSVVLLVDEYDAPLTHHVNDISKLSEIMSILNDFYATIKQYTGKFRLIFITGVTKASHVSIFSAFNNLKDLSLKNEFNTLLGFTSKDLKFYFDSYVENASKILNMKKEEVYKRLEQYYDGFQFSLESKETLYNPWSILSFLDSPQDGFKNYWFTSSGSSTIIMKYLKNSQSFKSFNYHDQELCISEDKLSDRYEIANIPQDILLFQTGYLTLRKKTSKSAKLVFPNTEVEDSILKLYLTAKNLELDIENYCKLEEFIKSIDQKSLYYIIDTFNAILNDCVSCDCNIFNDERSVRDIIYAAIPQSLAVQKIKERITVKGRSDLELITRKTRMVIEFKRTKPDRDAKSSLQEAIDQLKSKNYGIEPFRNHYLYRVAMVISTDKKLILSEFCQEIS